MRNEELAAEFRQRAASLRRIAQTMRDDKERDELIGIAAGYEAEAERLRASGVAGARALRTP